MILNLKFDFEFECDLKFESIFLCASKFFEAQREA